MYTTFYGLAELPFELSPNPKYLLLTPRHREALANLQYGISASKSLTLLTGRGGHRQDDARAGGACVRTVSRRAHRPPGQPDADPRRVRRVSRAGVPSVARGLAVEGDAAGRARSASCWPEPTVGVTTALVIDEAQCLSSELLEEVRLLSNIETPGREAAARWCWSASPSSPIG